MAVTNPQHGTRVDEIAAGVYRIHTPVRDVPGGFSFNQYLVAGEEPLLFHTGPRRMAALVAEAIATVLPPSSLACVAFSHFESDECGALDHLLALAPRAVPVCSRVNAMINGDTFARPPRALADGEAISTGAHRLRWLDMPHLPHAWECGYLMDETAGVLLCGDLFTQPGGDVPVLTTADILGPSEDLRSRLDYFSHTRNARPMLDRMAAARPTTLACMHGSAWQGDGARLLRDLADALER